jgi:hypothetical protein
MSYTKDNSYTVTLNQVGRLYKNGALWSSLGPSVTNQAMTNTLSGTYDPLWRHKVEHHLNAMTDMTCQAMSLKTSPGYAECIDDAGSDTWRCTVETEFPLYYKPSYDNALRTAIVNQARTATLRRLGSHFSTYTFLGEMREALHTIRHPALALRSSVDGLVSKMRKVRHRHRRNLNDFTNAAADTWLEYAFGWRPLVNDITKGAEAFYDAVNRDSYEHFSVRSSGKSHASSVGSNFGWQLLNWHAEIQEEHEVSCQYYGAARIKKTSSSVQRSFGLDPAELVATGWELIPYSFLIDYFVNVGDILNSWVSAQRLEFLWVGYTLREEVTSDVTVQFAKSHHTYTMSANDPGNGTNKRKRVYRRSESTIPLPSLQSSFKLSSSQGLNIAALGKLWNADRRYRR